LQNLLKKHAEKLRFALVGGANTAIDFGILFALVFLGVDKLVANFFSTGIAFIFSFFVNRSFTFKSTGGNTKKQFGIFLVITMFGLWVIQPAIIAFVAWLLASSNLSKPIILLAGKLLATVVTLIWNYILYSKFVFIKEDK
jgi:putative flippase GtrA